MSPIISQMDAETLESLFDIALDAEYQEGNETDILQYGTSVFYYAFGKNAAMLDVFRILGIRELYEKYRMQH